jgi:hypothetical protein
MCSSESLIINPLNNKEYLYPYKYSGKLNAAGMATGLTKPIILKRLISSFNLNIKIKTEAGKDTYKII